MRLRRAPRLPAPVVDDKLAAVIDLSYELLDAHADTARLATDGASDDEWRNHLGYLRDLQRIGREAIAQADSLRQGQPGASLHSPA
jgi:hypothetical protein